jgi:hypothetical protein
MSLLKIQKNKCFQACIEKFVAREITPYVKEWEKIMPYS